ncbi:acyl-CoA carboxylase subunit epsilon [Agromyces sp. ISL-38]|uniref:acyl-CoA carboxylase epsilon subunit n=1 Tax=Agromyces sp. ISL-38 TaxID=2819107 RepID=UPI001BE679D1|nr:acyl-CoA carboxylase epsilon subunit [Agromyces sp. ISL-38]MBT2500337.1 acyl-CoA carboxylase subunit epsilon [Agromyces sp. ISL-38]
MTDITPHSDADSATDIRFVTPNVSAEEAAAVTAVLLAAIDEGEAEASVPEPVRDHWVRSGGALRTPFQTGPGRWERSGR